MEAILDSSFIVSCAKRKIDFIGSLEELGFKAVVPREVLQELKDLRLKVNRDERAAIDIALTLINSRKIKKSGFNANSSKVSVDEQLIKKGQEGVYIATLDNGIKKMVSNRIVIDNATNDLKVERD